MKLESTYTKHYYIGSQRVSSALGTTYELGFFPNQANNFFSDLTAMEDFRDVAKAKVHTATAALSATYSAMNQSIALPNPAVEGVSVSLLFYPELYDAYFYHSDHLGSSNYISNNTGIVSQHTEYLPFGETFVDEHLNSHNTPFKFNAKEFDDETGNYYYGARYYNPKWSTWLSVDPLVEEYPAISPYAYVANNPIKFIDPDGRSIGVRKNDDGNYEVVSGNVKDNNRGVYLVDKDGNYDVEKSERIGTTKTTHSFFNDKEEIVTGAIINLKSNEGQKFLDKVIEDNPSLTSYMFNATNEEKYDIKDKGIDERTGVSELQHRYRGSVDKEGEIGSARDFGNIAAGLVAARQGLTWKEARAGFDTYQGYKQNGITILPGYKIPTMVVLPVREATTTVKAQMLGFLIGLQRFKRHNR